MPYLDPALILVETSQTHLTVRTPFWSVAHDLSAGGAPAEIVFQHGQKGNILQKSLGLWVDQFSDTFCRKTRWRTKRSAGSVEIVFRGKLADKGGKASAIGFETVYVYSPYTIRREVTLFFPSGATAKRIMPVDMAVDGRFMHYAVARDLNDIPRERGSSEIPKYIAKMVEVPAKRGALFESRRPPGWISLSRPGGEGMQIVPTGDLTPWDAPVGVEADGDYRLVRTGGGLGISLAVLSVRRPAALPRRLVFAASMDLVNLPAATAQPIRLAMIGNPPFADDRLLKAWADSGVEVVFIMEGLHWQGTWRTNHLTGKGEWRKDTDRFWRMGNYPCYRDKKDMRDLDRLIASSHRFGMKVVPYTGIRIAHQEVAEYPANIRQWRQQYIPNSNTMHFAMGNSPGASCGGIVCPDSASWRRFYLRHVKTLLARHDFDGIYVDLANKVSCYNTEHGPAHHGGIDGLWEAMTDVRRELGPDKMLFVHNEDVVMTVVLNNLSDLAGTLEAFNDGKADNWNLSSIAPYLRAFGACPTLMIPAYAWNWMPTPADARRALEDGIAKALVLGTIPFHLDIYWEPHCWGYKDIWQNIRDRRGVFELFRKVRSLRLDGMKFDDIFTGAVKTSRKGVLGARYRSENRQIVVLSNLSGRPVRGVRWSCEGRSGLVAKMGICDYRFIDLRTSSGGKPN